MGRKKKEEIAEDWCFMCKEGGILLLCEHRDCLKSYHPKCVGKDDSFLNSDESWKCDWHSCFICKKAAKFHCFCCPNAVCGKCLPNAEFIVVRGIKGFCNNCLNLALLWEEKRTMDSDGRKVDFSKRETFEFLFIDYWEIIKKNEGLNREHLQKAYASLMKGKNLNVVDNGDEISGLNLTNYEDWEWEAIEDYVPSRKGKKRKSNALKKGVKCKMQPKKRNLSKKEFIGWGSKVLIEFLESLEIDTSKELSPYDVLAIITKYIDEKKLLHPQRKKMIVCDQRLSSILGRKVVNKHKVYNLLEEHYAKSHETSEDDTECTSEYVEERSIKSCSKKRKCFGDEGKIKQKVIVKGCMASIISENIKLAYLRRSLVEELLKQPETFEDKVMGSILRVKSDPYDILQHFSHQLVQVIGVRKSPTKEADVKILFQVSSMPIDISIDMLSENDFTKEECNQLNLKIKDGVHKKISVEELELKAKELHGHITKHWIFKEIARLKNAIDNANETGQRRKLMECTERRNLLLLPHEQQRLMNEIPEVIPEVIAEAGAEDTKLSSENWEHMPDASSEVSVGSEAADDCDKEAVTLSVSSGNGDLRTFKEKEQAHEIEGGDASHKEAVTTPVSAENENLWSFNVNEQTQEIKGGNTGENGTVTPDSAENEKLRKHEARELNKENVDGNARENGNETVTLDSAENDKLRKHEARELIEENVDGNARENGAVTPSSAENEKLRKQDARELIQKNVEGLSRATETIDLSSDDDDNNDDKIIHRKTVKSTKGTTEDIESAEWYCMGPTGDVRGPYQLKLLQKWKQLASNYASKFKVWRKGQSPENGIPLSDVC